VVRQGSWPFSLAECCAKEEPEMESCGETRQRLAELAGVNLVAQRSEKSQAVGRRAVKGRVSTRPGKRGGRSLPPTAFVRIAPRPGASDRSSVIGVPTALSRGKSAPPDLGPPLKILVNQAAMRAQQQSGNAVVVPSLPLPVGGFAGRLTEGNVRAAAALQQANDSLNQVSGLGNSNAHQGVKTDGEGSDWYGRLMSRLQRLNQKHEDTPRTAPSGAATPPLLSHSQGLPNRGAGPMAPPLGLTSMGSRENLRQSLRLDVNVDTPYATSNREDTLNRTADAGRDLEKYRGGSTQPVQPASNEKASAPLDGSEQASMLLCELPSREERREMHAVVFHDGKAPSI